MVGVPGSSPVAPTRDLENDVGNECRNDSERADGDGEYLECVVTEKPISVRGVLATHFVEWCADPRSQFAEFGFRSCCQHHDVGASGRLFGIVGDEFVCWHERTLTYVVL